jgi:glycosyltransferase involved in cell wall biosynthesis
MRILLANEARAGGGGVETYLSALVPGLEGRGHEVALLYANAADDEGPTRIAAHEAWSVSDLGLERAVAGARAWRPDVCFSHNMRLLDVDARLAAGWPTFKMMHGYFGACVSGHKAFSFPSLQPCPRVCGPGCLVYFLPRKCGQLRPDVMAAQYGWARKQQRLFNRYAGVVVASDHMRREYLRYDLPEQRVHTIPLFAAAAERKSTAEDAAITGAERGAGVPASERVGGFGGQSPPIDIDVLFLGRMTPLKGPQGLVRAARHAAGSLGRPLRVVFAGEGPDRGELERLAQDSGGAVIASFPGWVDAAARAALLSRASLVAIPSIWPEPFGLVGLEAAALGVPAVAYDVGGIGEWLTHDVNGRLVDLAGGPQALGDAIAAILADDTLRMRLSAGARDASRHFSADAHMARLEQVLRQ